MALDKDLIDKLIEGYQKPEDLIGRHVGRPYPSLQFDFQSPGKRIPHAGSESLILQSSLPLKSVEQDFACDSSGFSTARFERWFDHKYGAERMRHEWVKLHIMCGVKTNIVTAVEIREKYTSAATFTHPSGCGDSGGSCESRCHLSGLRDSRCATRVVVP